MARFTIDLSDDISKRLEQISQENHINKAEAMRRAFSLFSIALKEQKKGNSLAIVREQENSDEPKILARLVGID